MTKIFSLSIFLIIGSIMACTPEEPDNTAINLVDTIDCEQFKTALVELDEESLASIINTELENFTELDLDNDACTYTRRLDGFIEYLNTSCVGLEVSLGCCECLESFPPQSELKVVFDSNENELERFILLRSPASEEDPLTFSGVN